MLNTHPFVICGYWSFLATAILVAIVAAFLGGFSDFCEIYKLLEYPSGIGRGGDPVGLVLAAAVVSAAGSLLVNSAMGGWPKSVLDSRSSVWKFLTVLPEEFLARGLLLGTLGAGVSRAVFFFLLFGSNLACSVIHLIFSDRRDRVGSKWGLVLIPQFFSGLIFSFIYFKCGLFAAIIAHFASDALMLAVHKIEDPLLVKDCWIGIYSCLGVLSAMFFLSMRYKSPLEMGRWLRVGAWPLDGWGVSDYLAGSIVVVYGLKVLGIFLCYDCGFVQENGESVALPKMREVVAGMSLIVVGVLGGCWLTGLFLGDAYRALLLTMILCLCGRYSSGSAVARKFWVTLPAVYFMVCVAEIVGVFWSAVYLVCHAAFTSPLIFLERKNV